MAKDYKRHSTGGRFKRPDIGDAGIRSLKEQQRDIIQSIKVRAAQDKEISNQQISGFDRATSKEQENRQVLKNLENDIFKNKTQNIKVHAGNEIDRLEGEAKELGKKSEFWKNFSTTYSQQYAQAAQSALDFKDRLWADKMQDFFIDHYPDLMDFDADNFREGAYETLDQNLRAALNKTIASEDPKVSEEARKEAKTILNLMSRTNRFLDARKVAQVKEDINSFEKNLKQTILNDIQTNPDSKLKWNAATIEGHYRQAAKNLIVELGIRPNSKEAKELVSLFTSKGVAASSKQNQRDEAIADKELNLEKLDDIHAANNLTRPEAVYQYVGSVKSSTIELSDGKYKVGEPNFAVARIDAATLSASSFKTKESFVKAFQNMLVENTKSNLNAPKVSWLERNSKPERILEDQQLLEKIWTDANKDKITQANNEKLINEAEGVKAIEDYIALDTTDLTTKEGKDGIRELETLYGQYEKPNNLLKTLEVFDFENKHKSYLNEDIVRSWTNGKPTEFFQLYNSSNAETKLRFDDLRKDMNALRQLPVFDKNSGLRPKAEEVIYGLSGIEDVRAVKAGTLDLQVDAVEDFMYKRLHELNNSEEKYTAGQKWSIIEKEIEESINYKPDIERKIKVGDKEYTVIGKGIFRRYGKGGSTVWLAFEPEPLSKDYDHETIDLELSKGASLQTNISNIIQNHTLGNRTLVAQDTLDSMRLSINNGDTVEIPYPVRKLWHHLEIENKNEPGVYEKWVGDLLGLDIPQGGYSLQAFVDKKSPLRVPNPWQLNAKEKAFVTALKLEAGDLGYWPQNIEFKNKIDAYGGLDNIDIDADPTYKLFDDPDRDYSMYYR